jgi:hypothetical protein
MHKDIYICKPFSYEGEGGGSLVQAGSTGLTWRGPCGGGWTTGGEPGELGAHLAGRWAGTRRPRAGDATLDTFSYSSWAAGFFTPAPVVSIRPPVVADSPVLSAW